MPVPLVPTFERAGPDTVDTVRAGEELARTSLVGGTGALHAVCKRHNPSGALAGQPRARRQPAPGVALPPPRPQAEANRLGWASAVRDRCPSLRPRPKPPKATPAAWWPTHKLGLRTSPPTHNHGAIFFQFFAATWAQSARKFAFACWLRQQDAFGSFDASRFLPSDYRGKERYK